MGFKERDVVIVGAGPSALTAAIYLSREDVPTTLYERGVVGGMAAITDKNILICLLIAIVASVIGAYFGTYIYNKFFSDRKKKSVL